MVIDLEKTLSAVLFSNRLDEAYELMMERSTDMEYITKNRCDELADTIGIIV